MLGNEEQNQKPSSLEIYSKYIVENSDTRFIKQIEAMTDKQKESWSKVELVICISVHATGDVEANIVHTIEKILLEDQTINRSKIGIVVYANCAISELSDPVKFVNMGTCFSSLEWYCKNTDINIQTIFEMREDIMTIGGIRKVCNDHAVNLIHNLQIDREIAMLCVDSDLIKIPKKCLENFKKAIDETVSVECPTLFFESIGNKPTKYNL
jgi:hypothetical protein